jgi:hypothetical protein
VQQISTDLPLDCRVAPLSKSSVVFSSVHSVTEELALLCSTARSSLRTTNFLFRASLVTTYKRDLHSISTIRAVQAGGPYYEVKKGWKDSKVSRAGKVRANLPRGRAPPRVRLQGPRRRRPGGALRRAHRRVRALHLRARPHLRLPRHAASRPAHGRAPREGAPHVVPVVGGQLPRRGALRRSSSTTPTTRTCRLGWACWPRTRRCSWTRGPGRSWRGSLPTRPGSSRPSWPAWTGWAPSGSRRAKRVRSGKCVASTCFDLGSACPSAVSVNSISEGVFSILFCSVGHFRYQRAGSDIRSSPMTPRGWPSRSTYY